MQFQITTIQRGKHAPQKTTNGDQHQHNMGTIISKELFELPLPTFTLLTSHITLIQLCAVLCWVAQSCPTLRDPMDCSPPGSSAMGILQARTLGWVAMASFRGPSPPRDGIQVSRTAGGFFTIWATREALVQL